MKQALYDTLQQTIRDVPRILERVMEQARKFCADATISTKTLDLFKFVPMVGHKGSPGTSTSDALT